jgi:hypothetical protein
MIFLLFLVGINLLISFIMILLASYSYEHNDSPDSSYSSYYYSFDSYYSSDRRGTHSQ